MIRRGVAALIGAGVVLSPTTTASADPPVRVVSEVYTPDVTVTDDFLTEECGFPVIATLKGHYVETEFYDKDGTLRAVTGHPSYRSTLSSPFATVSTADVGLDKFTFNDDGTITWHGTGIHLRLKGATIAIGLWTLVFDPETGEFVSEQYHGNFDVTITGQAAAVCDALAG
jgi:hypothetical protein